MWPRSLSPKPKAASPLRLTRHLRVVPPSSFKVKETLGESAGAQVPVAGSMLPDSTEQAVTIAGIWQSSTECVRQSRLVTVESPQPWRSANSPLILALWELFSQVPIHSPIPFKDGVPFLVAHPTWAKLKLLPLAKQQSHFPLMLGHPAFSDTESTLPRSKAVGQVWMHLLRRLMNSPFQAF
ncbi:hypothetical protein GH733_019233 [Mirounga leonina]|nr:hypothetical protein GH733_019233 [Mirounga leonina]